ncbi:hypothetical protein [Mucilaginibacter terrae]|uniref:hypothetical protein n=1 Tax=Mucilaginibacter terrae TaxID=1955052 RepID=UPI0028A0DF8E|nr:hypothetical protein [Mucilaginibacter terrae]
MKIFKPDFSWDGLDRQFVRVDSSAFRLIFQDGDRKFMDDRYEQDYYYSWQNRDKNFIEFTILTPDESSNCLTLKYFIFDKNGKFISKFDIANTCGDAGWTFNADGKQLSPSKFIYNTDEADSDIEDIWEKGDSASYEITINKQGKVVEREIYKRHFTRKTR